MQIFAQIIGWLGALLIVSAYVLVSNKRVKGNSRIYQLMNLLGAVGVGINAAYQNSWPSVGLQVVWAVIAIFALIR